ncbi:MAG: oligopeptide/dipeptide ABC transporter ATP-binding protein, partial [Bilophila wadsworthia]
WYSRRLQMIFQDPFSSLNPRLRIGTSIAEPLMAIGTPSAERQERVGEILRRVGLQPGHAGRYPHEFSGGQRQRVAIARALVTRPELVVCDEAVSALDASVQAQVLNLLKEVQADFGLTYFFISHDLSVVGYMSDRVAVMYLGHIVEQADRNTLFGSAAHPYTKALLAAAPVHDPAKRRIRAFLPGELPSPFSPPAGCAFHPRCPQAMPRCREEAPELREIAPDHLARCHLYG